MPRFLFRLDVSPFAGLGHLKRCLTLARELVDNHSEVFFLCRAQEIDLSNHIPPNICEWELMPWSHAPEKDAQEVVRVCNSKRIDTVIVDHYRADEAYQDILYRNGIRWLQFDGQARCPIWADWLLNMSPGACSSLYAEKIRKNAVLLLGPDYAILRDEFTNKGRRKDIKEDIRRILLTFGGGDDRGATVFCLEAIKSISEDVEIVVLLNSANPQKNQIMQWCSITRNNTKAVLDSKEISHYLAAADLGITAGGTTVFEMAALGVPLLMLQIADNQVPVCRAWQERGYGVNLGPLGNIKKENILSETIALINNIDRRKAMSETGSSLVDGEGARRVAGIMLAS